MIATTKSERIHSLDALRAIMMLLGIVLHSAETYTTWGDDIWPKDPAQAHQSLNYVSAIIHIFRMPIFFMVSGFFGAMLFYERGPAAMLINRVKRIVFPFIVFLLLLNPVILSALNFTSHSFGVTVTGMSNTLSIFPQTTYHMWFLYYLMLITTLAFAAALALKRWPSLNRKIRNTFERLMNHRVGAAIFLAFITFLIMLYMWDYWVATPLSFTPDFDVILFYSLHYFMGWLLFKSKHILNSLTRFDWPFTILAIVLFTIKFIWSSQIDDVLYGVMNAIISWLFIFGLTGLFIRYGSRHSDRMRYISDSSYWIFLIHLPITIFLPSLLSGFAIHPFVKFLVVMVTTTVICFVSYHLFVRSSFIGYFLNGRRYGTQK